MTEFRMPSLGADMEAGTLVAWSKGPGDAVRRGDLIAEVETDKGIIEIEAYSEGVIEKILVPVGQKVPVGTVLALLSDAGARPPAEKPAVAGETAPPLAAPRAQLAAPPAAAPARPPDQIGERLPMSPSARRLARELAVDPTTIRGTGPGGAITRHDVEQAAAQATAATSPRGPAAAGKSPAERAAGMRRAIAAAMSRSKREIPHYYLSTTIDMQPAIDWLTERNQGRTIEERMLYGVLLLKATARALREVPELNTVWENDQPVERSAIHLGVAISLRQGGLVAPAIHDADRLTLDELMRAFRDLVNRARGGGLRASELADPTITVTSLGEQGVEGVFGVIFPPQTAIVGFGRVVERPWSIDGRLMSRQVMTASLSADHRVTDGHRGGRFLAALDRLLQEPHKL
jgi:pyruvate dehydrogenase E2 component (dihydrolipoamide acetyltransferase)